LNASGPLLGGAVNGALPPRALWQFGSMIQCAQPGVNPFKYNNYGCWCGFKGSGAPVDDVDMCCQVHDRCYEASRKAPGCTAITDLPYISVYDFACSGQQVTCSGETTPRCEAAVCECDRAAAHCFAEATYNSENKNLDPNVHCR
uniref:Phospholipase A2 n=1 Tax=Mola mola TaxID=94237 RepID=A0A3Q3WWD4_MOLML